MAARNKQRNFKVYSGVTVDEVVVNGIPVMRRRSDDWFNATQMLKAAGLEKARRTRVLESEIQNCTHAKVQGGCGKYQGTWVPYDVGVYIARKYGIEQDIFPILYRRGGEGGVSPGANGANNPNTAAPSHPSATAHVGSAVQRSSTQQSFSNNLATHQRQLEQPMAKKRRRDVDEGSDDGKQVEEDESEDDEMETSTDTDSERDGDEEPQWSRKGQLNYGSSRSSTETGAGYAYADDAYSGEGVSCRTRMQRYNRLMSRRRQWAAELLEHFYTDNENIPRLFLELPDGFDVDTAIDADGHTSLHWAAALGRHQVVRHIVRSSHADAAARNNRAQTALMRAVSYANSYITGGFGEILIMLQETLPVVDADDRNVLHYVADTAPDSPMAPAARYYMEHIRALVLADPLYYAETVNARDARGETPLNLAARNRNETVVSHLLSMGADAPSVETRGSTAWDYTTENRPDQAFRQQPDRATSRTAMIRGGTRSNPPLLSHPAACTADVNDDPRSFGAGSQLSMVVQHGLSEIVHEATTPLISLVNERFDWIERQLADIFYVINQKRNT